MNTRKQGVELSFNDYLKYFFLIIRKQFNTTDDWKGNDTSITRLKVSGELCTRVVLLNNSGGVEEALDFCGQIGDLLWLICNKEE